MDKGKPEYGKLYALTGTKDKPCIMNGNTWPESEVKEKDAYPKNYALCKSYQFGCVNCLWAGIECKDGSMYKVEGEKGCKGYTYYD